MIRYFFLIVCCLFFFNPLSHSQAYEIKVKIEGFDEKEAYLGYHLMDKQYIKDTTKVDESGVAVFTGSEPLPGGVYLVIMPPDNQYFPLLINKDQQHFTVETTVEEPIKHMKVQGSPDNELYYQYMSYLSEKVPVKNELIEKFKSAGTDATEKAGIEKQLKALDEEVKAYHQKLIQEHPQSLTALIARTRLDVEEPEWKGTDEEKQMQRYLFVKQHWFDHYTMDDPRMLRTPDLFNRIDYYLEKLTPQHPDSISYSLDRVLGLVKKNEETFQHYLSHYLNHYAKSKVVGMDAVYVHLVDHYYSKGLTPWVDEENLKKIVDNANKLKPTLIGKTAPDIKIYQRDNTPINLHHVNSRYIVLIFWEPDCGHCKKTMPALKDFYSKFKPKGVEVMAVCTKKYEREKKLEEVEKCWKFLDENEMNKWINAVDPFLRSRYAQLYDVRSTPRIFILDDKKEIIVKGIGKDQLDEVMDQIIENEQKRIQSRD